MQTQQTIKCAFCGGRGTNPFYRGTCPVCKGRGKKEVIAPFVVCSECKGNGKKSGTSLTCFECRGIGVVADIREDIEKARSEIREVQREMTQETRELYGKVSKKPRTVEDKRLKHLEGGRMDSFQVEESVQPKWSNQRETSGGKYFCQSCTKEESLSSACKVCEECFFLYKFGEVRKIKPEEEKKEEEKRKGRK